MWVSDAERQPVVGDISPLFVGIWCRHTCRSLASDMCERVCASLYGVRLEGGREGGTEGEDVVVGGQQRLAFPIHCFVSFHFSTFHLLHLLLFFFSLLKLFRESHQSARCGFLLLPAFSSAQHIFPIIPLIFQNLHT